MDQTPRSALRSSFSFNGPGEGGFLPGLNAAMKVLACYGSARPIDGSEAKEVVRCDSPETFQQ